MKKWRYLEYGYVVHALLDARRPTTKAACGVHPDDFGGWLGDRTTEESNHAAELPKCKRCLKQVGDA